MQKRTPADPDSELLAEPVAARLLERASQLDVAQRNGSAVAELRAAATEAGISASAFNAALAEMHETAAPAPRLAVPHRARKFNAALALLLGLCVAGAGVVVMRAVRPVGATTSTPLLEEAMLLRCLTATEAAALIQPMMTPETRVVVRPDAAPRVLTIRATAAELQKVKQFLDQYEGGGAGACPVRPITAEPPSRPTP